MYAPCKVKPKGGRFSILCLLTTLGAPQITVVFLVCVFFGRLPEFSRWVAFLIAWWLPAIPLAF